MSYISNTIQGLAVDAFVDNGGKKVPSPQDVRLLWGCSRHEGSVRSTLLNMRPLFEAAIEEVAKGSVMVLPRRSTPQQQFPNLRYAKLG